jgi:alpha,alpha-trehalase
MSTTAKNLLSPHATDVLDSTTAGGPSIATRTPSHDRPGSFPVIGDLGVLSDGETTALIAPTGNVEWLCLPDPDSQSVFGALLDRGAGRFRVGPSDTMVPAGQRYLLASMVIETTWMTPGGLLMVRDALVLDQWREASRAPAQHRPPGDVRAGHVLLRTVKCVHGSVEVALDCEPMFDYGRLPAHWCYRDSGYHSADAQHPEADFSLHLDTSFRLGFEGGRASARATLRESDRAFVALSWSGGAAPADVDHAFSSIEHTSEHWRRWVSGGRFPEHPWWGHLHRSALTLKGLTYAPTGAVIAAPTTSLPRVRRGSRNWDYRYCFVRDSAWALRALYALGFVWEAEDFLAFLAEATTDDRPLQTLYRLDGTTPPQEIELSHLSGYDGARPVRVGNAAFEYSQHATWAALLDAAAAHARVRRRLDSTAWAMVTRQLAELRDRWREPDWGFWTRRGEPRHYTTSKVMCWVAAQRATRLADLRGRPEQAAEWRDTAAAISTEVLQRGVSEDGTFKEHFDSDELDASLLIIALVDFLPRNDERIRRTVLAIGEQLSMGGIILRRRPRAGEPSEGEAFTFCSWWFVAALVTIGELDRARNLAERLLAYSGHLGLYAEHLDPASGRPLGNFPHALTHLTLVDALLRLIHAEAARDR